MPERHIYECDLSQYNAQSPPLHKELSLRNPEPEDRQLLAALMLDSYSGTIDDDGGIMEDAVTEVDNYLRGEYGTPLLHTSQLALTPEGTGVASVLITRWGRANLPLVAFVMTHPVWQRKGVGGLLLHRSLTALKEAGESAARAVITDGNVPSERLFAGAAFKKIGTI